MGFPPSVLYSDLSWIIHQALESFHIIVQEVYCGPSTVTKSTPPQPPTPHCFSLVREKGFLKVTIQIEKKKSLAAH